MNENSDYFLHDLITLLREKGEEARAESHGGGEYEKGRHFAYYEVLSLVSQQALAFGMDPHGIGIADFEPERFLSSSS